MFGLPELKLELTEHRKKHERGVLAFALELGVPFTNNQAEQDLRLAKVTQQCVICFPAMPSWSFEGVGSYNKTIKKA